MADATAHSRGVSDDEPFAALAFKIMADPYVGKLTYFRVYSGQAHRWRTSAQCHDRTDRADRPDPDDAGERS